MNDQQWYYESNGQQAGPVSWEGLMEELRRGSIQQETRVWAAHLPEWTSLGLCMDAKPSVPITPSVNASPILPKIKQPGKVSVFGWVLAGILAAIIIPVVVARASSGMVFCESVNEKLEPVKPSKAFTRGVITYVVHGKKIGASTLSIGLYKSLGSGSAESLIDQGSMTVNPEWSTYKNVVTLVEPGNYRVVLTRPDGSVFAQGSVTIQ